MLVNFKRRDIIVISEWKNILPTHGYEKGEFASSQSGGYGLDFKINNASCDTVAEPTVIYWF